MLLLDPVPRPFRSPPSTPMRPRQKSFLTLATFVVFALAAVAGKHHKKQKPLASDAARFLTQATFGPTNALIAQVQKKGFASFLNQQFTTAATPTLPRVDQAIAALPTGTDPSNPQFQESWWYNRHRAGSIKATRC